MLIPIYQVCPDIDQCALQGVVASDVRRSTGALHQAQPNAHVGIITMKESALWAHLRNSHVFDWAERVESVVTPGLPDVHALIEDHEVWVELKVTPVRLRPAQQIWHKRWAQMGRQSVILARGNSSFMLWEGYTMAAGMPTAIIPIASSHWADAIRSTIIAMYEQDH